MSVSKKIIKYLDDNKYKYNIIEHKTTYTAWDTAQTEKVKPGEIAKALVMKVDGDYLIALIPGNRNLEKIKLLKLANKQRKNNQLKNYKKIDFAREAWMKKNIIGKVGATPPFRDPLGVDIYMDNLLVKNKKMYLGSGEYTESILVNVRQYLKIERPVTGNFSKKKA